jgi:hypothetical protein
MASGKHMVPQSKHFNSQDHIMSLKAGKERTIPAAERNHREMHD